MEHEPSRPFDHPSAPEPELNATPETEPNLSPIETLMNTLGYTETEAMATTRDAWRTAIQTGTGEQKRQKDDEYRDLADQERERRRLQLKSGRELFDQLIIGSNQAEGEDEAVALAASRGFWETDEMRALRARIMLARAQGAGSSPELFDQLEAYRQQANQQETIAGENLQLGWMLARATVWRDAGEVGSANEDIEDASLYADNVGLPDTAEAIQGLIIPNDESQ